MYREAFCVWSCSFWCEWREPMRSARCLHPCMRRVSDKAEDMISKPCLAQERLNLDFLHWRQPSDPWPLENFTLASVGRCARAQSMRTWAPQPSLTLPREQVVLSPPHANSSERGTRSPSPIQPLGPPQSSHAIQVPAWAVTALGRARYLPLLWELLLGVKRWLR